MKEKKKTMETKIYKTLDEQEIEALGRLLREEHLVAIPTETVYGLGGNGLSERAIQKIFAAKGRPSDNPLILHVPHKESIQSLVKEISPLADKVMDAFWPGPLTIILPKAEQVPYMATGGLETVALRCPDHTICRHILEAAGVPIAAPSANISGRPSPTSAQRVYEDMAGRIEAIADAGPCTIGLESTVIECEHNKITILRPGKITREMLLPFAEEVVFDKALLASEAVPKAPGMKYKHYAPQGEMVTLVGEVSKMGPYIVKAMKSYWKKFEKAKIGLYVSDEVGELICNTFPQRTEAIVLRSFGKAEDKERQGQQLYEALLSFDEAKVSYILAMGSKEEGLGFAIMNRLDKASSHKIVEID